MFPSHQMAPVYPIEPVKRQLSMNNLDADENNEKLNAKSSVVVPNNFIVSKVNHQLSCDGLVDDPYAPIADLDSLFDDSNDKDSEQDFSLSPRPVQEMMQSVFDLDGELTTPDISLSPALKRPSSSSDTFDMLKDFIGSMEENASQIMIMSQEEMDSLFDDDDDDDNDDAPSDDSYFSSEYAESQSSSKRKSNPNNQLNTNNKRQRLNEDNIANNNKFSLSSSPSHIPNEDKWNIKFNELIAFKSKHGHCQVPHGYSENPTLARWTKRQRYQYKLFQEGKTSTMTNDRIQSLENLGFVWDFHGALWGERYNELRQYCAAFGHSNVPSTFPPNPKLSVWVKCQRRQYKLLRAGLPSNMTPERVEKLNQLEFVWEVRNTGF